MSRIADCPCNNCEDLRIFEGCADTHCPCGDCADDRYLKALEVSNRSNLGLVAGKPIAVRFNVQMCVWLMVFAALAVAFIQGL